MALTNSGTDVVEEVNVQLMRGLLSAANKRLPMFNGTLPGELMGKGSTRSIRWERIENLAPATTPLAEPTGSPAYQNGRTLVQPVKTVQDAVAAKFGNAIQLTEEVDLLQVNVNSISLMETLGANAGETLNELMIDEYQTTTSQRFGAGVANDGAVITAVSLNDIKFAVNFVNRNSGQRFTPMGNGSTNVGTMPIRNSYYGIAHPDVEEDIRMLVGFISSEQYGGYTALQPGEFGTVGGVRFSTSELAGLIETDVGGTAVTNSLRYTLANTSADIYSTFIYGQEAVGTIGLNANHTTSSYKMYDTTPSPIQLITHAAGSGGTSDPFSEIATIAWKSWFAAEVLNDSWLVEVRTGASDLS